MKRSLLAVFAMLAATLLTKAAPDPATPSVNPGSTTETPKADVFGAKFLSKDRPKDAKTEITATKEATFDNASNIAQFTGKVIVRDPQFTLSCDNLKVLLKKSRKGMDQAIATGNVVIVQENAGEGGKTVKSIGHAGKAIFIPDTGEVVLSIWPSIQHGINNQVATEEGTVMRLNRSGRSETTGGNKTIIVESAEQK